MIPMRVHPLAQLLACRPGRWGRRVLVFGGLATAVWAAPVETRPVLGIGATREAVIAAYGWPNGQSQAGEREIFTYTQGQIVLKNGVVERMEFSPNIAWPKPKPRPGAPVKEKEKPPPPPILAEDYWLADFSEATRQARARPAQILALFTGSDWSPPCKRFLGEVAVNPAFLNAMGNEFVLLRLDFPTHAKQTADVRVHNATLRERYNVTTYPTLLILSAEGLEVARVDLAKPRPQGTYAEQVVAAVAEAKPKPAVIVSWKNAEAASPASGDEPLAPVASGWRRVGRLFNEYGWALGGALAVAIGCWWMLRRKPTEEAPAKPTERSLQPTPADIAGWTQERLRDVMAALFEFEGSLVQVRPTESGAELALLHQGENRPRVLVRCQSSAAGLAGGKSVRNLFATIVGERVEQAWYVSPGGFTPEARQFAREHGIVLIGGEDLLMRLKVVPPLALMRMLATKTA